jgi:hypothetical protein
MIGKLKGVIKRWKLIGIRTSQPHCANKDKTITLHYDESRGSVQFHPDEKGMSRPDLSWLLALLFRVTAWTLVDFPPVVCHQGQGSPTLATGTSAGEDLGQAAILWDRLRCLDGEKNPLLD